MNSEDVFQNNIDYKGIILRFLEFKKLYIFSILLFLVIVFVYNKFSPKVYQNKTTILIEESDKQNILAGSETIMKGMGLFGEDKNIENEIGILTSYKLIRKTLKEMDFTVDYFIEESFLINKPPDFYPFVIMHDLYKSSPVKVAYDPSHPQLTNMKFYVEIINDQTYKLTADASNVYVYNYIEDEVFDMVPQVNVNAVYKFGEQVTNDYFSFNVSLTDYYNENGNYDNLFFQFNNINYLTAIYKANLSTQILSENSSIVEVKLNVPYSSEKTTDFLNAFTSSYLLLNLEKKNDKAKSTVLFIDSQISDIADSLNYTQNSLRNFRTSQNVLDLSFQGKQIFEKISDLENDKAALLMQQKYYSYLKEYFESNKDESQLLAPSSMNVVDPILTNLISELLTLSAERATYIKESGEKSIYLNTIETQIQNLKKTIEENVNNNLNNIAINIKEIDYRMNKLSGQISRMPRTELQLKNFERKFKINDEIYTFLLQKRSEAQIARASNTPDLEVVDEARNANSRLVSPKKMLNIAVAFFLALLLPSAYILLKDFFNDKISSKNDIEAITTIPILGHVFHNFRKSTTILADHPKSSISESFRAVRTNFQFFSRGKSKQVIQVTSSFSGEGKTFCAINLATAFALIGKKTLLMEFDLRRPRIHQEFGSSNMLGISSYLINKAILDDIIQPTKVENLYLVTAGPIPPNPVELIGSDRTMEMIERLKDMYDYIIIDSAPVGVVTESYLLMKYSDINIYVVRENYTVKEAFANTLANMKKNNIENISILINDVDAKRDAYKYGYDRKYYVDKEDNRDLISRLLKLKSKAS